MRIVVKTKPKSKISSIEKLSIVNNTYLAKVTAPPEKGKANLALTGLLADHFNIRKNDIKIIKGLKSSIKIVEIEND